MADGEGWAGDVGGPYTVLRKKAAGVHQVTVVSGSYVMLFILKDFCIRSGAKLPKDCHFPSVHCYSVLLHCLPMT